jgi:hypothetical protein
MTACLSKQLLHDNIIVRSILRYHVNAGIHKNTGRLSLLSPEKYTELYHRIFRVAEIGLPITGRLLRTSDYMCCGVNVVLYNFNDNAGLAGRKWTSETASVCAIGNAYAMNQEKATK